MSALVLIATACSQPQASGPASIQPSAPSATSSLSTPVSSAKASPSAAGNAAALYGPERDIPAPCIAGGPMVAREAILWIACEGMTGVERGPAQILEYQIGSGVKRVVHTSSRTPAGSISQLRVSDSWIMWAEYTDFQKALDTKIYAQRRSGGDAILLDDAKRYGPLANLMETALDGADAYWSQPVIENGVWHGRLMHRTMPDGATEVALSAPVGSIITWPSVRDGAIAYERSSQTEQPQTSVVLRSRDGAEREIGKAPTSEPSLGDGFIAFKQSERYEKGDLRAYRLSDASIVTLGPGEAPQAFATFVTWQSSTPTDNALRLATPGRGCVYRLGELEFPQGFPQGGQDLLAWTHADSAHPGPAGFRIRYVSILISSGTPCGN